MTHAHTHHHTPSILAIALTTALALSTTTTPASARTFDFNTTGSMVQQPLPPQWACAVEQALTDHTPTFQCQQPLAPNATTIHKKTLASQRPNTAPAASRRRHHRPTAS
jgi:hypothetical protein